MWLKQGEGRNDGEGSLGIKKKRAHGGKKEREIL